MRYLLLITFFTNLFLHAYDIGRGYKFSDELHIGGYFATDYSLTKDEELFRVDDVAFLAYGNLTDEFSYLVELEAAPFYTHEFKTDTTTKDERFHKERLYIDYKYSENISIRAGKQITPIGYWNREPINVLRDTSSNPILSSAMFPKFLSGVDIYGYIPALDSVSYHMFGQKNRDLDEEYINIKNEHFFGFSIENERDYDFQYGGSLGEFITIEDIRSRFLSLNLKYNIDLLESKAEAVYSHIEDLNTNEKAYKFAAYVQSLYRIDEQHSLVGRYEYFKDDHLDTKESLGVFGYSYRPIYPVSIKTEYQVHSESERNKFIISFSVLF
jgi:hypothetical protein